MDLFDAALILAKEVYWEHDEYTNPNVPFPEKAKLHCDVCRAVYFVASHQRPVRVEAVRVSRAGKSDIPNDEQDGPENIPHFPYPPQKELASIPTNGEEKAWDARPPKKRPYTKRSAHWKKLK